MALVGLIQFYHTTKGLSKWKGGGYGMYSQIHFNRNEIWYGTSTNCFLEITDESLLNTKEARKVFNSVKRYPNKKKLEKLANLIENELEIEGLIIQVWRPKVNTTELTYTRELIYEFSRIE